MGVPAVQHPAQPQLVNCSPSLKPRQGTRVIYVRNASNRDVGYPGYKWASVSHSLFHCNLLQPGWRVEADLFKLKEGTVKKKNNQTNQTLSVSSITQCYESFNTAAFQMLLTHNKINCSANGVGRIQLLVPWVTTLKERLEENQFPQILSFSA